MLKSSNHEFEPYFFLDIVIRDHPFKTSAFFRVVGVKNLPNLPTDSSKKTADSKGVGIKNFPTS